LRLDHEVYPAWQQITLHPTLCMDSLNALFRAKP
jgi:hypothetical protein